MVASLAAALLAAGSFGLAAATAHAQGYPSRPIALIVPWSAGSGPDATVRVIASLMEKDLGKPINIVTRASGAGVAGHQAIASAPADGYTIGLITEEITLMHRVGLTQLKHADFAPVGLVSADPAGVVVRADAPYASVEDLLAVVRANPGRLKASGMGQGGIWHLALAGMLKRLGIDPAAVPWVPSQGAASALQDLLGGSVELVVCPVAEARARIDAGRVKLLAIMDPAPAAWRVVAGPKGMPADVQETLGAALKKATDSKDYKDFMASRGFGAAWADAAETARFMAKADADNGVLMRAAGLAK